MLSSFQFSKASRNWTFVILAGALGFAAGFAVVSFYGPSRLMAAPFGLGAAALAGPLVNARFAVRIHACCVPRSIT
jgi:hypothetical protein